MMLMLWFFHMVYVAADWMVMPLCLSSSMESIVAPTPSFPFTFTSQRKAQLINAASFPTSRNFALPGPHLMNLCYPARVVEDPLGQGGLPRVDVSRDADIADSLVGEDPRGAGPTAVNKHLQDRGSKLGTVFRELELNRRSESGYLFQCDAPRC